jgi:7-cyano-7-deazaguanine synthase
MPEVEPQSLSPVPFAVVLLSGGLDSTTVLAIAQNQGYQCHTLAFDYGQRHRHELDACNTIAKAMQTASHRVFTLDIGQFGGSALTSSSIEVPKDRDEAHMDDIPVTYVPARNLVFLSIATAYAETLGASDLFIGVNAIDYSGYPDCRPEFINSFARTANLATKMGVEGGADGGSIKVHTPLIDLTKAQIIARGSDLGVDYALTHSCYDPDETGGACGRCDSCALRRAGFIGAGIDDPTRYTTSFSPNA